MASYISFIAIFLSLCLTVSALDCYVCNDCRSATSFLFNSETCPTSILNIGGANENRCSKEIAVDGTVNRGCLTQAECVVQEGINRCEDSEVGCTICCNGNDCNGASMTTVSMVTVLLAACHALYRLLQ
ncbi:uncharacterized protein [Diadema setosum]|uniref:uncharacterized protein n=1 Tax=Diadema setosum TaxID=31175 RepID=UPI003B3B1A2B